MKIICHINKIRGKTLHHYLYKKIQLPFTILKTLNKIRIEGNHFILAKDIYKKPAPSIIFNEIGI